MATLRDSGTFNLDYGDLVVVRVRAVNAVGDGEYSQVNTEGATIETEPTAMGIPVIDYSGTTLTKITVTWSPLSTDAETGGSAVDTYHLEYSDDSGTTWTTI